MYASLPLREPAARAKLSCARRRTMDLFDSISAFIAVADAGSFSAAARRSGVAVSSTTRAVSALERDLGAIRRSTHDIGLTEAGRREHVSRDGAGRNSGARVAGVRRSRERRGDGRQARHRRPNRDADVPEARRRATARAHRGGDAPEDARAGRERVEAPHVPKSRSRDPRHCCATWRAS